MDYALTADEHNTIMVHRADCPEVRRHADAGKPVITLMQCQNELPKDLERHSCLAGERAS
jgi:hypothetical protein